MSKGSTKTQSTVTQSNLPEYAEPYYTDLLDRSQALTQRDYTPYPGQRMAPMAPDSLVAYDAIRDMAGTGIPFMDTAANYSMGAMQDVRNLSSYDPYQFSSADFQTYGDADPYGGFHEYDYDNAWVFSPDAASFYMSPYMQEVVRTEQDSARRQFDISQGGRDARAVQQGAYGGSRHAVEQALAEEDLQRHLGQIQTKGMQSAYEAAHRAYLGDHDAAREVDNWRRGEEARVQEAMAQEYARTQGISIDEARRVQQAQADELARVQSAQAAEDYAARQFALEGLGYGSDEAARLFGYGEAGRSANIQDAQLMEKVGESFQRYQQAGLDMAFDDFLRQEGFPEAQLQLYSSLLQGVPISPTTTTDTYTPYNPVQELLGAGISALGLYQGLTT